jgi:orc1/cdc6 family replication initiation protein
MITDARVLREEFVPADVVHRDAEVNALSRVLEPISDGEDARPALVTGPSGVGKTTITKFVVGRLKESLLDIESVHVNCWQSYTRFGAIYAILEGLGQTLDVHRRSTPHDELLEKLAAYDGPPVIVTLDEVDQLDDARLVYDLYRLDNFSFVLVTNDEEQLLADLDERVRSRLQTAETIHFDRYHVEELTDIIAARAEHGLVQNAITTEQLAWIADAAAGDARIGLSILRSAARRADQANADTITPEHIQAAIPEGRHEVRSRTLDTLRPGQRLVYEIVEEHDQLSPKEIYEAYADRASDPRTKRTVRSWLGKLTKYNLLEAQGSGPNRVYEPSQSLLD